jgi:serine/threonine-protein kinase
MLESSLLTVGTILENRYQVIRELGRGGFGRTYLAEDLNKFREKCVLKEFAPQVQGEAEIQKAKELFEREAGVLYKLKHSQIPAFREIFRVRGVQGESLFLVQEQIEGVNYCDLLNERIKQGKVFSEGEVIQLFRDLLPVIDYIHSLDVIHRDISPDNIIYRHRDRLPVLIDFGGVKEIAAHAVSQFSKVQIGTRIGKQGYAPDEQMIRGKVYPSSDLYALAATALTLLTGKEPTTMYNASNGTWEWQKYTDLSPKFAATIEKMLQYRTNDRYQSAREVLAALPASNHPVTPVNQPAASEQQHRIARPSLITKLKTLVISPVSPNGKVNTPEPPTRDPNEWKQPALQVTKVVTAIFLTAWGISAVVKWVQAINPLKMATDRVNDTATAIEKSIPNPFKKSPSAAPSRTPLGQRLQQANISPAGFYRQVDRAFYAKHPELNQRPLSNRPEDVKLRQEWEEIAHQILDKQTRSTPSLTPD